jgi:single-strand DNA-binding protein
MSARVTLIGTVGKEPELKVSQGGKSYAQFSVATWTGKKGEDRWWKVMAFGPLADEVARIVRKGSYVEVEGKFDYSEREWQGKKYQDFTCFADRVTEKEKPVSKVQAPESFAQVNPFMGDLTKNIDLDSIPF